MLAGQRTRSIALNFRMVAPAMGLNCLAGHPLKKRRRRFQSEPNRRGEAKIQFTISPTRRQLFRNYSAIVNKESVGAPSLETNRQTRRKTRNGEGLLESGRNYAEAIGRRGRGRDRRSARKRARRRISLGFS